MRRSTLLRLLFGLAGACVGIALAWWFAASPARDAQPEPATRAPTQTPPASADAPAAEPPANADADEPNAP